MRECDVIFWHLEDVYNLSVSDLARQMGYAEGHLHNMRTGRKPLTDRFKFRVAKLYPGIAAYVLQGKLPAFDERRTLFLNVELEYGHTIEDIAKQIGMKVSYLKNIRAYRATLTDAVKFRLIDHYRRLLKTFIPRHKFVPLQTDVDNELTLMGKVIAEIEAGGVSASEASRAIGYRSGYLKQRQFSETMSDSLKFKLLGAYPNLAPLLLSTEPLEPLETTAA